MQFLAFIGALSLICLIIWFGVWLLDFSAEVYKYKRQSNEAHERETGRLLEIIENRNREIRAKDEELETLKGRLGYR